MKIVLEAPVALALETAVAQSHGLEFSGFGWVQVEQDALVVYDYLILHVGSHGFTSIPSRTMLELMVRPDAASMKLWVHRHPVGDGSPGPHNWSSTDNDTCLNTPLGGIPELVKWSAAIVRTPRGWVGRLDNHIRKTTLHVPVLPDVGEVFATVDRLYLEKLAMDDARLAAMRVESRPGIRWPWKGRQMALPAEGFDDLEGDDDYMDWAGMDDDWGYPASTIQPRKSIHAKVQSFFRRLK